MTSDLTDRIEQHGKTGSRGKDVSLSFRQVHANGGWEGSEWGARIYDWETGLTKRAGMKASPQEAFETALAADPKDLTECVLGHAASGDYRRRICYTHKWTGPWERRDKHDHDQSPWESGPTCPGVDWEWRDHPDNDRGDDDA